MKYLALSLESGDVVTSVVSPVAVFTVDITSPVMSRKQFVD